MPTLYVGRNGMLQSIEEMKEKLICRYCNWKFEVDYEKTLHEKVCPLNLNIRRREGLLFNCDDCDFSFSTKYLLKSHKKHECGIMHVCKKCNKVYSRLQSLQKHYRDNVC